MPKAFKYAGIIRDRTGSATVEFAIISLSFIVLIPVIYDLSSVINSYMKLSGAVRAGTQYALSAPDDTSDIARVVQTATGFPSGTVTVTVNQFCQCLSVNTSCGSVCSDGTAAKTYDKVTASYPAPIILPYGNYPNNSYTISSYATVQVK